MSIPQHSPIENVTDDGAVASKLVGTNFAFMWSHPLSEGLGSLAGIGFDRMELTVSLPHIDLRQSIQETAGDVRKAADRHGVSITSLNPVEMNLISANSGIADATVQQLKATIDLAAAVEAPTVVVVPGRMNSLCPMDRTTALASFHCRLQSLLEHAERRRVNLALENTPFGFLQSPTEIIEQIQRYSHERLGLVVDAANLEFLDFDVATEVRAAKQYLMLAHISDTDRDRFAHGYVGAGTVDYRAFAENLAAVGFVGDTVNELVTPRVDWRRWQADVELLKSWGWK